MARKILHDPNNVDVLFDGGKRAGKTVLVCYDFLELACQAEYAGIRQLMVRECFNHAKMSLWYQTLLPMVERYFPELFDINRTDFILTNKVTGSQIWIGGLDDKDRTEKIFGQEFARIFLNEATLSSPHSVMKLESILAQKIDGFVNQMIYDCNPRSPAHFLYKKFYLNKKPRQVRLTWTPYDNIINLPKEYIARLEQLSETERRRYLKGEWCAVEGAVYENVFEAHKIQAVKDWARYDYVTGGIDFGYCAHVSIWGIRGRVATCLFGKDIYGSRTASIISFLDQIPWLKKHVVFYCDHENDRILELQDAGYMAQQAHKEVGAGDSTVNDCELWFDVGCEDTFQSMLNLMRKQDGQGNYLDQHEKNADHGADSARYALHSARIENGGTSSHISAQDYPDVRPA